MENHTGRSGPVQEKGPNRPGGGLSRMRPSSATPTHRAYKTFVLICFGKLVDVYPLLSNVLYLHKYRVYVYGYGYVYMYVCMYIYVCVCVCVCAVVILAQGLGTAVFILTAFLPHRCSACGGHCAAPLAQQPQVFLPTAADLPTENRRWKD